MAATNLASAPLGKASFLEALNEREGTGANDRTQGDFDNTSEEEDEEEEDDEYHEENDEEPQLEGIRGSAGVIAPDHGHENKKKDIGHQKHVRSLEVLQRDYMTKVSAAEDAKSVLEHEEQRLRDLRKQVAQPGSSIDPARLKYQEGEVAKVWGRLTDVEKARDMAELALHQIADTGAHAARQVLSENLLHSSIARERQLDEVTRATRVVQQDLAARQAAEEAASLEAGERSRRQQEAKHHKGKGVRRLQETLGEHNAVLAQAEMVRDSRFDKDSQRLLGLKENMDRIGRQVQASNEKKQKKKGQTEAEQ